MVVLLRGSNSMPRGHSIYSPAPLRQHQLTSSARRNRNSLGRCADLQQQRLSAGPRSLTKTQYFRRTCSDAGATWLILGCDTNPNILARQADSKLPSRTLRLTQRVVSSPPISSSGPLPDNPRLPQAQQLHSSKF
jgi:hypothetical protein